MSSQRWLLATPGCLKVRLGGSQVKEGSRKMDTLPEARATEACGASAQVAGPVSPPYLGMGSCKRGTFWSP